jgi:hypothetical protein
VGFWHTVPQNTQTKPELVDFPSSPSGKRRVFAQATIFYNGIGYCSLSEAVCGTLLELFVPGFEVREGETFQIPAGSGGGSVDFRIGDVLIEFHGLRFNPEGGRYGDFSSRHEYAHFARNLRRSKGNPWKRRQVLSSTRDQLTRNYFERRRRLVDATPELCMCELVVATSCDEFYELVIQRFNAQFCPTRGEFRDIFQSLVKVVAQQNQYNRRLARRA